MFNKILTLFFLVLLGLSAKGQQEMHDICPLKVGEDIPEATIFNIEGNPQKLSEVVADRPVVLIFYRGGWCPYCTRHLSAIQEVKSDIKALGFDIVALTPDNFAKLDVSLEKTKLDFELYSDKDVAAIQAFGLGWKVNDKLYNKYRDQYKMDTEAWSGEDHHILPVPAVYIIKEGKVQFQYVNPNYSVRLSPNTLLAMLQSLQTDSK